MAKRKSPVAARMDMLSMPEMEPHEEQAREMHDALYELESQARSSRGGKLLPKAMRGKAEAAKKHIRAMHSAMKGCAEE